MAYEVWYVLEDDSVVDPAEVAPTDDGRLRHAKGFVAMRGEGLGRVPSSRGVDPEKERAKAKPKAAEVEQKNEAPRVASSPVRRDMQPAKPAEGYKTR
jgi:hypothetical protein